ncbi:MAG: gamma-glutamyl-gamma-aminobutyrate hydrolase family protein [Alphaproteobacteria bacterium]|nr:gamma-glutamyl-gamma-aminobutyrate hydrolase family protein [Alphaproteobacteria bacterium]OJV16062.1 MAG: hypothetical protein BGO27_04365 [Alphaproteobacteria bacterium 33-17]
MTVALVTMRRDYFPDYKEYRDSIDPKLIDFLQLFDIQVVLIPNHFANFEAIVNHISCDIVILSGGGSVNENDTESLDRIHIENYLIDHAIRNNKKVFGICRGMQAILKYFKNPMKSIENHVRLRHNLIDQNGQVVTNVNSYHNNGFNNISDREIDVLYRAPDNTIECIKHSKYNIMGVMWHPEREENFKEFDINLFKGFLQ